MSKDAKHILIVEEEAPEGALPEDQWWIVEFLNDTVRKEFRSFPENLKKSFWNLHSVIRYFGGIDALSQQQSKHLQGNLWELRFKSGRGIYVKRIGKKITVLAFFAKKTDKTPKHIFDLADERSKTLKENTMETLREDLIYKPIDAMDVFRQEYNSPAKLEQFNKQFQRYLRRFKIVRAIRKLPPDKALKAAQRIMARIKRSSK